MVGLSSRPGPDTGDGGKLMGTSRVWDSSKFIPFLARHPSANAVSAAAHTQQRMFAEQQGEQPYEMGDGISPKPRKIRLPLFDERGKRFLGLRRGQTCPEQFQLFRDAGRQIRLTMPDQLLGLPHRLRR